MTLALGFLLTTTIVGLAAFGWGVIVGRVDRIDVEF